MSTYTSSATAERIALLRWIGGLGAVTAEALAVRDDSNLAAARARLGAAQRAGQLARRRPLTGHPSLYTLTARGARAAGVASGGGSRVGPQSALHLIACSAVAASLGSCYPDHRVLGERDLCRYECERGRPLASASLGVADGRPVLHRPDLVLLAADRSGELPVAVEVELAVKAPRRLAAICRAWARCREVAGVIYIAGEQAQRPLERAIERAGAGDRVVVVSLEVAVRTVAARA
jgi:hypothetical protein